MLPVAMIPYQQYFGRADDPRDHGEYPQTTTSTVASNGTTVHQMVAGEAFSDPTVVVTIDTRREGTDVVRFAVPKTSVADVGDHPEFASGSWCMDGDCFVFETAVSKGEEATTVYTAVDETHLEDALDGLEIIAVEPVDAADGNPSR